jgi:hypothetical protein
MEPFSWGEGHAEAYDLRRAEALEVKRVEDPSLLVVEVG